MTPAQALFKMSIVREDAMLLKGMICRQNFRAATGETLQAEFCAGGFGTILIQSIDCPENRMVHNVLFLRGASYLKDTTPLYIHRLDVKFIFEALMWGKPHGFDDTLNEVRFKL